MPPNWLARIQLQRLPSATLYGSSRVIAEILLGVFIESVTVLLHRVIAIGNRLVHFTPVRHFPGGDTLGVVVRSVLDHATAFDHQCPVTLLAEFLGGPATRDTGPDHDRVEYFLCCLG